MINTQNPQQGSIAFFAIFAIVIIFSVMLVGGGESLFTGNEPSSITEPPTSETPTPTATPSAGIWTISANLQAACQNAKPPYRAGILEVKGPQDGYIKWEVDSNGFREVATLQFTQPDGSYDFRLTNDDGFDTNPWRVSVYSGGEKAGNIWSGGTLQKTETGLPTGCK